MSATADVSSPRTAEPRSRLQARRRPGLRPPSFEARMMAPALSVLAAISIVPFVYVVVMSLSRVGLIGGIELDRVGFDNWTRLFSDSLVGASWVRTVIYFVATVGLELLLGVAIALLVVEWLWGRNIVLSLLLMPMFMAPVIVGLLGRFLTDSTYGLYAWALKETGLYSGESLASTTPAFVAVTLMDVWEWTPLIALIVLAGLTSMPQQVIEAAQVDGANYWQRLRHIVAPMLTGVILIALLVRSMDALRYYDIIVAATNGGRRTPPRSSRCACTRTRSASSTWGTPPPSACRCSR